MIDYRLYLVTDDPSRYEGNWLDNVVAAVEGGVTCVQYRDTESAPSVRYARVRALQDALAGRVPLVVNNEAELAAAVRAEGVHVGQGDLPPEAVRRIVGPACEIGLSITRPEDLARLGCADALGIGPVFDARKTKANATEAMGLDGLAEILNQSHHPQPLTSTSTSTFPSTSTSNLDLPHPLDLPTIAIGGITLANAREVLATGVDGLAVVSAFSKSKDPYETARDFTLLSDDRRK